ncbi:2-oxoacid:acceptor oxidoreductase family protein [Salisediminibacterium selenitireducens]|uniref:Pyruvate/ketoisovalerate oxidoreductase n=1 Tax=Bacillus selenitireducens (strain ATCC 700615 / DSM 15326 / MLS10) TaxID=439292 RepID=D6XVC3_BACIE|nr:2-oxoacid:acceptor oxidoreductase family protein [Salisediminibacterium selenitireducens]ADH99661.1 Pyruvate/ketoisovalerate oxidoreductase [[Bacillus] selenitireducens MLS10]
MKEEIIIAGFGGQGVMSMGQLLTFAGMKEGKEVSSLPSYGPEQRGGTANVQVVISDEPFGSPVIDEPSVVIVLNEPSFQKFESRLASGGVLIVNADLVHSESARDDITVIRVPASTIAISLSEERAAGMVILGALIGKTGVLSRDALLEALEDVLGKRKAHLIPVNEEAIKAGEDLSDQGEPAFV